ncbi:MAG: hypothetical protein LBB88_05835 [Planctomycetaceae bacterium]|nr:hypothetical protein [Planctomycetaceae bacterium]
MGGRWGHWGLGGRWGRSCLKSGIDDSEGTKVKEKNFSFLKADVFC